MLRRSLRDIVLWQSSVMAKVAPTGHNGARGELWQPRRSHGWGLAGTAEPPVGSKVTTYRAWALIVAPFLPTERVEFSPGTFLEPLHDVERPEHLIAEKPIMNPPQGGLNRFAAIPGRREVRSTCALWMTAEANTDEAALTLMLAEQLPLVLAALSEPGYMPARAEVQGIGRLLDDGRVASCAGPWSYGTAGPYEVEPALDLESLKARYRAGQDHQPVAQASLQFADAVEIDDLGAFHLRAIGNSILNYFLVVERIARALAPDLAGDAETADKLRAALDNLASELGKGKAVRHGVTAVRRTMSTIDDVTMRRLSEQISSAADRLGVRDDHRDEALEVQRIRNRSLGHAGALQAVELIPHREKMQAAALAFLDAYVESTVPASLRRKPRPTPSSVTLVIGNNHLQERHEFNSPAAPWPAGSGTQPGRTGTLKLTVTGPEHLAALGRLLTFHHASALLTAVGYSWYVRLAGEAPVVAPDGYPAQVAIDVVEVPFPGPTTHGPGGAITCDQCGSES
jgi:hypothetical protein